MRIRKILLTAIVLMGYNIIGDIYENRTFIGNNNYFA